MGCPRHRAVVVVVAAGKQVSVMKKQRMLQRIFLKLSWLTGGW